MGSCTFSVVGLRYGILERVPFPEFVVVVLQFVPLLQVQVVVREKVVVVLGADHLVLHLPLHIFVRIEEVCPILFQLVVVVLVVEVLPAHSIFLHAGVAVVFHRLVESCCRLYFSDVGALER